jgi:hypothetical protein
MDEKVKFYFKLIHFALFSLALCGPSNPALSGNLSFLGYTATNNGNLGGLKGANTLCDATYPGTGARAMTYDDFLSLGTGYSYAQQAWLIDGASLKSYDEFGFAYFTHTSNDGSDNFLNSTNTFPMCMGWTAGASSLEGSVLYVDGSVQFDPCNSSYVVACVK